MTGHALSVERGASAPSAVVAGPPILARYEAHVRERPAAAAIDDGSRVWSYAELDAAADRIAGTLASWLAPGQVVAVCGGPSATIVAVAVAVAKLGAAYLALGSSPGDQRLLDTVRRLGITCLIRSVGVDLPSGLAGEQIPLPVLGSGQLAVACVMGGSGPADATRPAGGSGSERPLYAVLTSGSTGEPKAVLVGGQSLTTLLHWCHAEFELGPDDRISMLCSPAFDTHLFDLWAPLCHGATLCVPSAQTVQDPAWVVDWWRRAKVTVSLLPTPIAELVFEQPWPAGMSLRHLLVGGERLRRWPPPDVTATVHNVYGPAEATIFCTTWRLNGPAIGPRDTAGPPPIGRPVDGATVVVTDAEGTAVPRGEPGELRVGGRCLSLGYADPELTTQRFVAPPAVVARDGGPDRIYRTGDLVRMRPDGVLEFLGRLDDQVKISGVRVEPAEVEAALERHPQVLQAVVVPLPTPAGTRLVAFVRPVPGASADATDVLEHARPWLVEQAVPAEVHVVPEFPLTSRGKIDRAAVLGLRPSQSGQNLPDGADGPGVQAAVLRICRDLLGQPAVSIGHSFTDAGGNSLAAAMMLEAIEAEFGVRLRAVDVLRQPDLRSLARLIESWRAPTASEASPS